MKIDDSDLMVFKVKVDNELFSNERKRFVLDSIISGAVQGYSKKDKVRHLIFRSSNYRVEENRDTTVVRIDSKAYLALTTPSEVEARSGIRITSAKLHHSELINKEVIIFDIWIDDLKSYNVKKYLKISFKDSSILFQKECKYYKILDDN